MPISPDDVVEVLSDMRLRSIRFSAGPIQVNVDEYDQVADFIESGAISLKQASREDGKRYKPGWSPLYRQNASRWP